MINIGVSKFVEALRLSIKEENASRFNLSFIVAAWNGSEVCHYTLEDQKTGFSMGFSIKGPPEYTYTPTMGDVSCGFNSRWMSDDEILFIAEACLDYRMMLDTVAKIESLSEKERGIMDLFMKDYT